MKRIYSLAIRFAFAVTGITLSSTAFSQVNVTATGGTASASYASLRLAFNAINAGTHT